MAKPRRRAQGAPPGRATPSRPRGTPAASADESLAEAFVGLLRRHEPFLDIERLSAWLGRRHGSAGHALSSELTSEPLGQHHARLSSLGLALDYEFGLRGDELLERLAWIEQQSSRLLPRNGRILEIGSDIGLLTAFEALLAPASTVLGIDSQPRAIPLAIELSARLEIPNTLFESTTLESFLDTGVEPFDFVRVDRRVIDAAVEPPTPLEYWDIADLDPTTTPPPLPFFTQLTGLVAPGGLAAFEVSAGSGGTFLWWARTIGASGWSIDWALSDHGFATPLIDQREVATLVVQPSESVLHVPVTDVVSFLARAHLAALSAQLWISGTTAEALLAAFETRRLLLGVELSIPDLPPRRTELFEAGPILLISRTTGNDNRDVLLESTVAREAVLKLLYLTSRIDADLLGGSTRTYGPEGDRMRELGDELMQRTREQRANSGLDTA